MTNEIKILTGIVVGTILIVVAGALTMGGKSSPNKQENTVVDKKILIHGDSHKLGPDKSKVTLVEFGDFQCPACGASYPIVSRLLLEYKGKITFVFREFPLPVHENAKTAAYAAEAAGAQGKFFEMYDKLYSFQRDWGESKNARNYFDKYAKELKLDVAKFKKDIDDKKYDAKIQNDINDGNTAGVGATPTFFINGKPQVGGLPYDEFKTKIEEALKSS